MAPVYTRLLQIAGDSWAERDWSVGQLWGSRRLAVACANWSFILRLPQCPQTLGPGGLQESWAPNFRNPHKVACFPMLYLGKSGREIRFS